MSQSSDHGRGSEMSVMWHHTLREINRQEWNRLATKVGFYSSYDWLLTQEMRSDARAEYITVRDSRGELLAGLPLYEVHRESNKGYDPQALGLSSTEPGLQLVLGNRRGYRSGTLMAEDIDGRIGVAMSTAILDRIDAMGTGLARWFYVPDRHLSVVLGLNGSQISMKLDTDVSMPIHPDGFPGFLASFRSDRRWGFRRERQRFLRTGYEVSQEHVLDIANELGPLLVQVEAKYGSSRSVDRMIEWYETLGRSADPGIVLTCRNPRGRLVGFCHFYHFGSMLWGRTLGFDYTRLRGAYEYFNLAFYEPIEWGAEHGARSIHLGTGSMEAKLERGGIPETLWSVDVRPET